LCYDTTVYGRTSPRYKSSPGQGLQEACAGALQASLPTTPEELQNDQLLRFAEMPPRYRVNQKDLQKGAKIEQKIHPWASDTRARRMARDNLQQHPKYYATQPVAQAIMHREERGLKPIRRKPQPRPFNPLTDSPW